MRVAHTISREQEYFSPKELSMWIGHAEDQWLLVLIKELIDNALDAAEQTGNPLVVVSLGDDFITVRDNGSGIPESVIIDSLDYTTRTSDKTLYVSPSRGQLGNALKLIWATPYVVHGKGIVSIASHGVCHTVEIGFDPIAQEPTISHEKSPSDVKSGTSVTLWWDNVTGCLENSWSDSFYIDPVQTLIENFCLFNPHIQIGYNGELYGEDDTKFKRWDAGRPSVPAWFEADELSRLIAGTIHANPETTVGQFVSGFFGLKGSAKQKLVTSQAGLSGKLLTDMVEGDRINCGQLLMAMRSNSKDIQPKQLGVIGKNNMVAQFGAITEAPVKYRKIEGFSNNVPFVAEIAVSLRIDADNLPLDDFGVHLHVGLNHSALIKQPIYSLRDILSDKMVGTDSPVSVAVHIVFPKLRFSEHGKGSVSLPSGIDYPLNDELGKMLEPWEKMELRRLKQKAAPRPKPKTKVMSFKEACHKFMEEGYLATSDNGELPANARQVMYAVRKRVISSGLTNGEWYKTSASFTQNVLPDFLDDNPELTAQWDVVFDDRGHLIEPHTGHTIGLGTLAVRQYIQGWHSIMVKPDASQIKAGMSTRGPNNRFNAVLFLEKEGFLPLLKKVRLAERYDIALMSTKGLSVVAARRLVDHFSGAGTPVYVVRDFDKAGFSIAATLGGDSRRYKFKNTPNVIDLGLRLDTIEQYEKYADVSEIQRYPDGKNPAINLAKNGATDAEIEKLAQQDSEGYFADRVELNALTSRDFLDWIESELQAHGVEKVIPDDETVKDLFEQEVLASRIRKLAEDLKESDPVEVPFDLGDQVRSEIKDAEPWNLTVRRLANVKS